MAPKTKALVNELRQFIAGSGPAQAGLAARQVDSDQEILIDPDLSFHPASTIKICVMAEIFRQARQGLFSLDEEMRIRNEFASIADHSPYSLSAEDDSETDLYARIGQSLPIRDLIQRMITSSSNLATNILIERATPVGTTEFMRKLGSPSLILRRGVEDDRAFRLGMNNAATARGLMDILVRLAKGEVVTPADSDEMLEILSRQKFNQMIPAKLPPGTRVAHKTGWTGKFYHDAGIIYAGRRGPFALAILTNGFEREEEAHEFIASLTRIIYDAWTSG